MKSNNRVEIIYQNALIVLVMIITYFAQRRTKEDHRNLIG